VVGEIEQEGVGYRVVGLLLLVDKLEQLCLPVSNILELLLVRIIVLVIGFVGSSIIEMNSTGKRG
jgi:hypothetical protein